MNTDPLGKNLHSDTTLIARPHAASSPATSRTLEAASKPLVISSSAQGLANPSDLQDIADDDSC
jgi:hypothetical protein